MNTILGYFSTVLFKTEHNVYEAVASLAISPSSINMGRYSVVGTATGYGLDGLGIESRWGARFSAFVQTGPGAHPAPCTMSTGSLPRG